MNTFTPTDAVVWAYRMLLGREPENDKVIEDHVTLNQPFDANALRAGFLRTSEFALQVRTHAPAFQRPGMLALEPYRDSTRYASEAGFFRDIVGIKTRLSYLPDVFARFSGMVPGDFEIDMLPLHDDVELFAMVHAFRQAGPQFVVMELGAGWGPWTSMGGAMARGSGKPYRLIAVEGLESHYQFLQSHMQDNALRPEFCRLVHGIVGTSDGTAQFPKVGSDDYGVGIQALDTSVGEFDDVPCWTIATLLKDEPVIDLLHCDIQGHEVDALTASFDVIDQRVKRVIVGTHGRTIEEELYRLFESHNWVLELDEACRVRNASGKVFVFQDGAQLWVNPKLF